MYDGLQVFKDVCVYLVNSLRMVGVCVKVWDLRVNGQECTEGVVCVCVCGIYLCVGVCTCIKAYGYVSVISLPMFLANLSIPLFVCLHKWHVYTYQSILDLYSALNIVAHLFF